jgi:hypothetical protein
MLPQIVVRQSKLCEKFGRGKNRNVQILEPGFIPRNDGIHILQGSAGDLQIIFKIAAR